MKIAVELKIDVTKIDKSRIFHGKKGKYLDMTVFIDTDNKDEYGNNGMITHKRLENESKSPILGNCKVFWKGENTVQQDAPAQQSQGYPQQPGNAPSALNSQQNAPVRVQNGAAQSQQNANARNAAGSPSNQPPPPPQDQPMGDHQHEPEMDSFSGGDIPF